MCDGTLHGVHTGMRLACFQTLLALLVEGGSIGQQAQSTSAPSCRHNAAPVLLHPRFGNGSSAASTANQRVGFETEVQPPGFIMGVAHRSLEGQLQLQRAVATAAPLPKRFMGRSVWNGLAHCLGSMVAE